MGKQLLQTKKLPCGDTYQKFHLKILVLGISLLPPAHQIGSKVLAKIPYAHLKLVYKLTSVASRWTFQVSSPYLNGHESVSRTQDHE